MSNILLSAKNMSFTHAENQAPTLEAIDITVEQGQLIFLTGASGSGKSTFLHILNGIIPEIIEGKLEGQLALAGKTGLSIEERSRILGNVFQNPRSQFFTTQSTSELVFEMENLGFSKEEMTERLTKLVDQFHIEELMDRNILELSSGERQFLALLTALIVQPDILIFDEPSANLDYGNAMRLKKQLVALKKEGKTIIVADHRCFYLDGLMNQVWLLDQHTLTVFPSEEAFHQSGYEHRVTDLFDYSYTERQEISSPVESRGLKVEELGYRDILKEITFAAYPGQITALVGVNGAGKTTLAKILAGVLKPTHGKVDLDQQALYIMQDADFQLFGSSCLKELEITSSNTAKNQQALSDLGLEQVAHQHPQQLSGGEKQRLQMAIAMVSDNEVILLDEPTSGLDRDSMLRLVERLHNLKQGKTILVITHDYEFIRESADRILYLKDGQIADDFALNQTTVERLNKIYNQMEEYYENIEIKR